MKLRSLARTSAMELDDAEASTIPEVYDRLKEDGSEVKAGTRIFWKDGLKKAAVTLWDTRENNPDNAPDLWEDINYINGYRVIPETITVTTAFAKGEKGWWKDTVYESIHDGANVWNPDQFAAGWRKVE